MTVRPRELIAAAAGIVLCAAWWGSLLTGVVDGSLAELGILWLLGGAGLIWYGVEGATRRSLRPDRDRSREFYRLSAASNRERNRSDFRRRHSSRNRS